MAQYHYADDEEDLAHDKEGGETLAFTPSPYERAQDAFYRAKDRVTEAPSRLYLALAALLLVLLLLFTLFGSTAVKRPVNTGSPSVKGRPAWLSDLYHDSFGCPGGRERIGYVSDGGKWFCGWDLVKSMDYVVLYSLGIGRPEEGGASYEAEVLRETNAEVWGYDFSVEDFGPSLTEHAGLRHRAHFFPWKISGTTEKDASPPTYNLQDIMETNGHDYIDLLKIDVEGWEFQLFDSLIKHYDGQPLPFSQLQIEVHLWRQFPEIHRFMRGLENAGLRPTNWETNQNDPGKCAEINYVNIKNPRSPWYIKP